MKIETKFSFNDVVYPISYGTVEKLEPCEACNATGKIEINGEKFTCPKCHGLRGKKTYLKQKWQIQYGLVGDVKNIRCSLYVDGSGNNEIIYMLTSTGVGTGTLWPEDRLFSSVDDAQAECDRRNAELAEE